MNDRLLAALRQIKTEQDSLKSDMELIKKQLDKSGNYYLQRMMKQMAEDLSNYSIQDGEWYFNGRSTGIKAEGIDGKDGAIGPQGIPGRDGKDGKPGRDGITPTFAIGKVETSPEYGGANAKLRLGKNGVLYLDLTLPRGPQGFPGFDAKVNGRNTIEIEAGANVNIDETEKGIKISSLGGDVKGITDVKQNGVSVVTDGVANVDTPDMTKYYNKTQVDKKINDLEESTDAEFDEIKTLITDANEQLDAIIEGVL